MSVWHERLRPVGLPLPEYGCACSHDVCRVVASVVVGHQILNKVTEILLDQHESSSDLLYLAFFLSPEGRLVPTFSVHAIASF
jgi:hypothetical protein